MASFMLLLRGNPSDWTTMAPEQMQHVMGRYFAWTDELRAQGREVSANQLMPLTSKVVSQTDDYHVVDGPYIETKESVGGYYIVTAKDMDDALAVARDCPALLHGSTVEVVQIAEGAPA